MRFLRFNACSRSGREAMLLSVLTLLVLYLVGTIEVGLFHATLHNAPNEAELHSAANEGNACHLRVYHNQKEKECEHKSHVVANKKCSLCQLSMQTYYFFVGKSEHIFQIPSNLTEGFQEFSPSFEIPLHLPSRAPPTV